MPNSLNDLKKQLGIKNVKEHLDYLNFLVYADPGVGKTYLGATAQDHPDTSPLLILDAEGGTTTIRNRDVDVIRIKSFHQAKNIIETFQQIEPEDFPYKTVMLDSASEMQKVDMAEIMAEALEDKGIDKPTFTEWGATGDHMRWLVRSMRDLPCHTFVTALTQREKSADGEVKVFPQMPGKMQIDLPGYMDVVCYYYTEMDTNNTIERLLLAQPTKKFMAKDRTGNLEVVTVNPTFPELWEQMKSGKVPEKEAVLRP